MSISLNLTPQRGALLRGYNNEFYGLLQLIDKSEEIIIRQENL